MKKALFILPFATLTFACASSYNAVNMVVNGEVYVGETVENIGKNGDFSLLSPDGVSCEGEYAFKTELTGKGKITCTNKKEGSFVFSSEKISEEEYLIKGYGRFNDGSKFSITFGEAAPRYVAQQQDNKMPVQYRGETTQPYSGQLDIQLR